MTEELKADYCIVGGGPAGAVLASRLAASGKSIILLDQGPRFTEKDRAAMLLRSKEALNDFAGYNDDSGPASVTPHTSASAGGQTVEWLAQRQFGLGGTTLHYQGFMFRPIDDDLRVKSLFGYGRDWPIGYSELEPWLLQAEQETGVAGDEDNPYASKRSGPFPMPAHDFSYFDSEIFGPALKRLGIKGHSCPRAVNSVPYKGRSQCQACRACVFCPSGARYSADRVHVRMIDELPNVRVMEDLSLRRLETGAKGDAIVAAHAVRTGDMTPVVIRATRYVLAMGGVETPRLLMLSAGSGPHKNGLGNMGGQLGQRLSDHTNPVMTCDVGRHAGSRLGFETMITDHFRAPKDRGNTPPLLLVGSPAIDWVSIGQDAVAWATRSGALSLGEIREMIPRIATIWSFTELEGNGTIELDSGRLDAYGDPVARVTMRLSDWDRNGHKRLSKLLPDIAEAMGAKHVSQISPPDYGLGYHPSGTTAMAKTPDDGVCDKDLKVFGLDNLHLVSSSVFPHMGPNPPTLTIVALALRLAAHLEGRPNL